jgi:hypothetical protein
MKNHNPFHIPFLATFILFFAMQLTAQQDEYFVRIDSTATGQIAVAIRNPVTGNFLCVHNRVGVVGNGQIMIVDTAGTVQWIKDLSVEGGGTDIIQASDGNYIIVGQELVNNIQIISLWKVTPLGNLVWDKRISQGGTASTSYAIAPTYDGGCMLSGSSTSTKYLYMRFDGNGNTVWQKNINYSFGPGGLARGLTRTADSCYVCSIWANYAANNGDTWIFKFDTTGNILWVRGFDTPNLTRPIRIIPAYDGGFIILTESSGPNNMNNANLNGAILRVDSNGHFLWAKAYPHVTLSTTTPFDIKEMPDHGIILFEWESGVSSMIRTDSAGNLLWVKTLNNNVEFCSKSTVTNDVIYILGRYHYSANNYRPSVLRLKDDSLLFCSTTKPSWLALPFSCTETTIAFTTANPNFGNVTSAITMTTPVAIPVRTLICNNVITGELQENTNANSITVYPNPFSSSATLKIATDETIQNAELNIYDVFGNLVQTISGINSNEVLIERGTLASGIYFYKLKLNAGNNSSGKFIISE